VKKEKTKNKNLATRKKITREKKPPSTYRRHRISKLRTKGSMSNDRNLKTLPGDAKGEKKGQKRPPRVERGDTRQKAAPPVKGRK